MTRCEAVLYGGRRVGQEPIRCPARAKSTVLDAEGTFRDVCGQHRRYRAGASPYEFVERR